MKKYKNILFDFGNVIVKFDVNELLDDCCGFHSDRLKSIIFHDIDGFDAGKWTNDEYMNQCLNLASEDEKERIIAYFEKWYKVLPRIDEMCEWICELKEKGYRVYLLSNAPVVLEENMHFYPILSKFDGIVFSGSIQMIKPNHEIYEFLLKKYDLNANECFFIDDKQVNVDAAIQLGIDAIVYHENLENIKEIVYK